MKHFLQWNKLPLIWSKPSTWVINKDWMNKVKPRSSKLPHHGQEVQNCQSSLFEHSVAHIWRGHRFLHQHQPLCWWKSDLGNSHSLIHVDSKHFILPQSKGEWESLTKVSNLKVEYEVRRLGACLKCHAVHWAQFDLPSTFRGHS